MSVTCFDHVTLIMPRSQEFGFYIENLVRTKVHGLPEKANDTGIHDIPKEENRLDPTETQSIKTTGGNAIDCGDVLRVYDYDRTEKHTMVVFRYEQKEAIREINATLADPELFTQKPEVFLKAATKLEHARKELETRTWRATQRRRVPR